jgi:hypothetical protein
MLASSPVAAREAARGDGTAGRRRLVVAVLLLAGALAATGSAGLALGAKWPRPSRESFPGGAYFVVWCSATHRSNDDPIVFPRQPGRSHSHTFVGNRSADAFSTPDSLRDRENSTCAPATDASAYWFPTLYERGHVVMPLVTIIYYVRHTGSVRPFPAGLRVIAGNPRARRPQRPSVVSWTCGPPARGVRTYPYVPNCAVGRGLQMNVSFPDCWDGRRVDSADHARHMAYSSRGRCPGSHEVALPSMKMLVVYPAVRNGTISSGRLSAHGDFMNGWEQAPLAELVRGLNY